MAIQLWSDRIWVVVLAGEPALSDVLLTTFNRMMSAPRCPDLVIDLSGVPEINSTNLGQLIRLRKVAVTGDSVIRLTGPRDAVWAVFLTTGLDKVFEFRPDVASALVELQARAR